MKTKKVAEKKIDNSNLYLPPEYNTLAEDAFNIYRDMLKASSNFPKVICSRCAKNFGRRTHFHASEFGICIRQTQLNQINSRRMLDSTDHLRNIFLYDGHLHEQAAIEMLHNCKYELSHHNEEIIITKAIELPYINDKLPTQVPVTIINHPDLLIRINEVKWLFEFKAIKDWGLKNKIEKRIIPKQYYGQCQIYMEALGLDNALLMFKSRHTSEIFPPFIIKRNPIYIRKRFEYLAGILISESLVPKEYNDKDCDACKFCPFYETCW